MDNREIGMVRPNWNHKQYHIEQWEKYNITVLICQRKTNDLIHLSLESLLRFYPDIKILVVDGDSNDNSLLYLRQMSQKHSNVTIWERPNNGGGKHTSHGTTMDEAIKYHIDSRYVLLLDSDVIIERGGFIEDMLGQLKCDENMYAIGTIMLVSRVNHAFGSPKDENDVLRYAHPSCSIYNRDIYLQLSETKTNLDDGQVVSNIFCDHGSPCVYSMMAAEKYNFKIEYYPVDKYVSHLSGSSWTEPRTIWPDDHSVPLRPFITFIVESGKHINDLKNQTDHDFDIITLGNEEKGSVVIHDLGYFNPDNKLYNIRYNVMGEYVCYLSDNVSNINKYLVNTTRVHSLGNCYADELSIDGVQMIKRQLWQKRECLQ